MRYNLTFLLTIIATALTAQDHKSEFSTLFKEGREEEILPLLQKWQKARPDDAEMYIAYFNYYLHESKQEIVRMADQPGTGKNLTITDTATHEPVGYMFSEIHYNDSLFDLSQRYLTEGISRNPARLDMYFGRIYSLREKGLLNKHVASILALIDLHKPGVSHWRWSDNEKLPNPEEIFKGSIQDYVYALYELEEPYTEGIQKISEKMMLSYPDDVENYSNLGVCHLIARDFPGALEFFKEASARAPDDPVVLSNIAYTYLNMGEKEKAIKFYKMVVETGSLQHKDFAESQIRQLEIE